MRFARGLYDTAGALKAAYEYDPYGKVIASAGSLKSWNPFGFSTKFTDTSGLIYYGYRYYSPALGRFVNRDSAQEAGGLNLYRFCENDGVNKFDYLGKWSFWDWVLGRDQAVNSDSASNSGSSGDEKSKGKDEEEADPTILTPFEVSSRTDGWSYETEAYKTKHGNGSQDSMGDPKNQQAKTVPNSGGVSGLQPNASYLLPVGNGTTATTDANGRIVRVDTRVTGENPQVFRINKLVSATIPGNTALTADLSKPGQVTYDFSKSIVVSIPLLPNPTIDSVTIKVNGDYVGYDGTNGYFGKVDSILRSVIEGDYRPGLATRVLVDNIESFTQISGTPIPIK